MSLEWDRYSFSDLRFLGRGSTSLYLRSRIISSRDHSLWSHSGYGKKQNQRKRDRVGRVWERIRDRERWVCPYMRSETNQIHSSAINEGIDCAKLQGREALRKEWPETRAPKEESMIFSFEKGRSLLIPVRELRERCQAKLSRRACLCFEGTVRRCRDTSQGCSSRTRPWYTQLRVRDDSEERTRWRTNNGDFNYWESLPHPPNSFISVNDRRKECNFLRIWRFASFEVICGVWEWVKRELLFDDVSEDDEEIEKKTEDELAHRN